jgi:hypothetical protein
MGDYKENTTVPVEDAATWSSRQLREGEPKQIAASSSEGLAAIVVTALGRGPESESVDVVRDYVRMVTRVLSAIRGKNPARLR